MIYVKVNQETGEVQLSSSEEAKQLQYKSIETRHDWKTFDHAATIAENLSKFTKELYVAVDNGEWCSPRFDITKVPQVGDEVSYAFNGDSYPCGKVAKVSASLKVITTDEGRKFYRKGQTASWKDKCWCLISGHIYEQNPHV